MRYEALIEKDGKKIFVEKGEKNIGEILFGMDNAVKREIEPGKK